MRVFEYQINSFLLSVVSDFKPHPIDVANRFSHNRNTTVVEAKFIREVPQEEYIAPRLYSRTAKINYMNYTGKNNFNKYNRNHYQYGKI